MKLIKFLLVLHLLPILSIGQTTVIIGPGFVGTHAISSQAPGDAVPYNYNDKSVHIQVLYTAAELNSGGATGAFSIDSIGWYVMSQIGGAISNYQIKMKNTNATNVLPYDGTGLSIVRNPANLNPAVDTAWYMIPLDTSFAWDGTSNLLIDICWGLNSTNTASGTIRHFNPGTAMDRIFSKSNFSNVCGLNTNSSALFKPYLRLRGDSCSPVTTTSNINICAGQSYNFNGVSYSTAGTYIDTFIAANSCDSFSVLNLGLLPYVQDSIAIVMCNGAPVMYNGQLFSTAGIYHDTLSASTGCDTVRTIQVINQVINNTAVNLGQNLSTTQNGATWYQWYDCLTNAAITGATGQIYSPTSFGSYYVVLEINGCIDTSNCIVYMGENVINFAKIGINKIYPNPVNDVLIIEAKKELPYALHDYLGRKISEGKLENGINKINVSQISSGLYILKIDAFALKIMVE